MYDYVYAVLAGICLESRGNGKEVKEVVVRFDSEEQLQDESDNFFDNIYEFFNSGLQKGWFIDESPEIAKLISPSEAENRGYVIFRSKNRRECVRKSCPNTFLHGHYTPIGDLCYVCYKCFVQAVEDTESLFSTKEYWFETLHYFVNHTSPGENFTLNPDANDVIDIFKFLTPPND
jgi:hypothetical protein